MIVDYADRDDYKTIRDTLSLLPLNMAKDLLNEENDYFATLDIVIYEFFYDAQLGKLSPALKVYGFKRDLMANKYSGGSL
jgi:hypothetical protein